mmetsp:Transcript_92835/g.267029  ORF Transcript_92835/g.267029 Transcript_92835/m.267029 type:complete len:258 (+) Transcript_92835:1925-2698(+)
MRLTRAPPAGAAAAGLRGSWTWDLSLVVFPTAPPSRRVSALDMPKASSVDFLRPSLEPLRFTQGSSWSFGVSCGFLAAASMRPCAVWSRCARSPVFSASPFLLGTFLSMPGNSPCVSIDRAGSSLTVLCFAAGAALALLLVACAAVGVEPEPRLALGVKAAVVKFGSSLQVGVIAGSFSTVVCPRWKLVDGLVGLHRCPKTAHAGCCGLPSEGEACTLPSLASESPPEESLDPSRPRLASEPEPAPSNIFRWPFVSS